MMKPKPNDYDLALSARDGDRRALTELVERLRAPFFSLAYAELRHYEDAQDAVAAALLRVCKSIGGLRQPERLRPWADSIVRNEVRRIARQRCNPLLIADIDDAEWPMTELEALAMRLDIQAALRRLPAVHTRALTLFYLEGQPIARIASRTEQPSGTVKSWLHHGRRNLAIFLQEYGPMTLNADMTEEKTHAAISEGSTKRAALVHTSMTPENIRKVVESLRLRGYETHLPGEEEYARLKSALATGDYSVFEQWTQQFALVALDEIVEDHPALEHVINLRADPDWNHVLIYVLMSEPPSPYTAMAYSNAGVSGLIFKRQSNSDARTLEFSEERTVIPWQRFTERARRTVLLAEDEAKRFGETSSRRSIS